MNTVYNYYDATGTRRYIDDDDFVTVGPWNSSTSYVAAGFQVTSIGANQYLCITDNTNHSPAVLANRRPPTVYWSPLVKVGPASVPPDEADAALSLAGTAYSLASAAYSTGTDALELAQSAFDIAVSGTNGASGAFGLASEAYALAVVGTNAAGSDTARLNTGLTGTNSVWGMSTENGVLTDTQLTFVNGLLTEKSVDVALPTSTDELFSFVKFINFIIEPSGANAVFGTFVVDLTSPDYSWTNGNTRLYNRIGNQDIGEAQTIMILDGAFESAGTVMSFQIGSGNGVGKFGTTSAPTPITKLWSQGTYYMWNKNGAPPGEITVSLRLDGLVFIGGGI